MNHSLYKLPRPFKELMLLWRSTYRDNIHSGIKKMSLNGQLEKFGFFLSSTKCCQGDGPSQPLRPSQMLTENPQPHKGSALKAQCVGYRWPSYAFATIHDVCFHKGEIFSLSSFSTVHFQIDLEAQILSSWFQIQRLGSNSSLLAQISASRLEFQPPGLNSSLQPQIPASRFKFQPQDLDSSFSLKS